MIQRSEKCPYCKVTLWKTVESSTQQHSSSLSQAFRHDRQHKLHLIGSYSLNYKIKTVEVYLHNVIFIYIRSKERGTCGLCCSLFQFKKKWKIIMILISLVLFKPVWNSTLIVVCVYFFTLSSDTYNLITMYDIMLILYY
jgi:hypothetical protein